MVLFQEAKSLLMPVDTIPVEECLPVHRRPDNLNLAVRRDRFYSA